MALAKYEKGEVFHTLGRDTADFIEILAKGSVEISNGLFSVVAKTGAILGLAEKAGTPCHFSYRALEDVQVMQYAYKSDADIAKIIGANAKSAPVLAAECVRLACETILARSNKFSEAMEAHAKIMEDYAAYPDLCASCGEFPKSFEGIKSLQTPDMEENIQEWEIYYLQALLQNSELMRKNVYALSPEIATGTVMFTARFYDAVAVSCSQLQEYEEQLKMDASPFTSEFQTMHAKAVERERAAGGAEAAVEIKDALETILNYAEAAPDTTEAFRKAILEFRENERRYDSSDDGRVFRRNLSKHYFEIYNAAFLKTRESHDVVPSEVKMMLQFGFVDEVLAGEENTSMLYSLLHNYSPDPEGKVVSAYEWLNMIYDLKVEPSRNEFDQDYPTYLREQKTMGEITQEKMDELMESGRDRFLFEAKNLFALGCRVTFGNAAGFVPVFDKLNLIRPMNKAFLTPAILNEVLNKFRSVDFGLFSRQKSYSNPGLGINQIFLNDIITPYFILMPVTGSRGSLWQEIEGKNRSTPARMLLPAFFIDNLEDAVLKLCGDFRWEMCKTEQGIHWNDVTDPSLTAYYCDYLQFFKKNHSLSEEMKEKVRTQLKKFSNNYKNFFIADYVTYINYEAEGSPRLNKVAREILFTFCPFPKEMREKMEDNPQFRELIKKYNTQSSNKRRPLVGLIKRMQTDGVEVPKELMQEYDFLSS